MIGNVLVWAAALLAAAAVAVAAVFIGWWALLVAALLLVAGGLGLLLAPALRGPGGRGERPPTGEDEPDGDTGPVLPGPVEEAGEHAAPDYRRKHVFRREVPSAREDYALLFSAVVCWRGRDLGDGAAEGAAVASVMERVRAFTLAVGPEDAEAEQPLLAAALGAGPCRHPGVWEAWAEEVRLELPAADAERLRHLREVRKRKAAREEERELERLEREYLGGDVLADPGRAVVWWLARNPDRIEEAVDRIATLTRLSSAATGSEVPEVYRDLIREVGAALRPAAAAGGEDQAGGDGAAASEPFAGDGPAGAPPGDGSPAEPEPGRAGTGPADLGELWAESVRGAVAAMDEDGAEAFIDRIARELDQAGRPEAAEHVRERFGLADAWAEPPEGASAESGSSVAGTAGADAEGGAGAGEPSGGEPSAEPPVGAGPAAGNGHAAAAHRPTAGSSWNGSAGAG
ncbi:hypothetical protein [Nocardiopsis potens]|uniref:hypothetical protein n=1 Tax=Nocardiopsis potens TaxID=1246458 RepID=UPI000477774E|nr:hypothetical protein [Nocardiopsis potens]